MAFITQHMCGREIDFIISRCDAGVANIRRVHSTLLLRGSVVSPLIIPNMGHSGDD